MTLNKKKFELQSCRFRRNPQVSYEIYLHPSSYKKVTIFENRLTLTTMGHDSFYAIVPNCRGARRQVTVASATAVVHGGLPLPPWATTVVG
jgi:hypothetical protein